MSVKLNFKSLNFFSLIYSILFLFSCTNSTIVGHWKCDSTGVARSASDTQSFAITEFYSLLKLHPFELVFTSDGQVKSIAREISGDADEILLVILSNREGNAAKFLLIDDSDHTNDFMMTVKSLTKNKLEASFEFMEETIVMDLRMDRIQ